MSTFPQDSNTIRSSEYGLVGFLDATRVPLPLKGVEARFEVAGEVAHVELDQIYHQTAAKPLDCLYSFPLPADAAVHRCEFHVNGRVISARIEELAKARELYHDARTSGKRAALMEAERANLFTLNLANVQPNDLVVVRLAYVQTLERVGNERRLRIPFCPGIRYVPGTPLLRANCGRGTEDDTDQVPDASRLSPPRIDAFHPDAAYLAVSGILNLTPKEFGRISTQSHPLTTTNHSDHLEFSLAQNNALPDQDFLLGWELLPALNFTPRAWSASRGEWTYSLIELRAPAFSATTPREPIDVYVLLDRSGSMEGTKWTQACVALGRLLESLGEGDRIQVTCFESTFQHLVSEPVPVDELRRHWPTDRIEQLGTAGGTEILPALMGVLQQVQQHSAAGKPVLVLITDGQVANEASVVAALQTHPRLVLHAFGIDTVVNDALLLRITRQQRGRLVMLRPDEDIPAAIARLGTLLAHPVITDLKAPEGWESADGPLPDLYADQTATTTLRGRGTPPATLTGRGPDGRETLVSLASQVTESAAVPLLWARRRLAGLEGRGDLEAALPLAKEFNLLCQGAAFVAWDDAENVPVASEQIYQPSQVPARGDHFLGLSSREAQRMDWTALRTRQPEEPGCREMRWESFEPFYSHHRSDLPRPFSRWCREPMFGKTRGNEVYSLLQSWLDSQSGARRLRSERRLSDLIADVLLTTKNDPAEQLKALVGRLDELIGRHGRFRKSLEALRQSAGW